MAAEAAGRPGRSFLNSLLFRGLALPAAGKGQGKQAEKQQDGAVFFAEVKRHGGRCILRIDECSRHTTLFAAMATSRNCTLKNAGCCSSEWNHFFFTQKKLTL
jgi:hypothetical protein